MVYKSADGSEYMHMKCMISGHPKKFALGRIEGALLLANDAAGITATASRAAALAAAQAKDSNCQTHIGALVVAKTVRDDTVGGRGGQDGHEGGQEDGQRPFDRVDRDLVPAIRGTKRAQRPYRLHTRSAVPAAAQVQERRTGGLREESSRARGFLSRVDFAPPLRICEVGQNTAAARD